MPQGSGSSSVAATARSSSWRGSHRTSSGLGTWKPRFGSGCGRSRCRRRRRSGPRSSAARSRGSRLRSRRSISARSTSRSRPPRSAEPRPTMRGSEATRSSRICSPSGTEPRRSWLTPPAAASRRRPPCTGCGARPSASRCGGRARRGSSSRSRRRRRSRGSRSTSGADGAGTRRASAFARWSACWRSARAFHLRPARWRRTGIRWCCRRWTCPTGDERAVAAALRGGGAAIVAPDAETGLALVQEARRRGLGSVTVVIGERPLEGFEIVEEHELLAAERLAVTRDGIAYDPERQELWFAGEAAEAVLLELEARRRALVERGRGARARGACRHRRRRHSLPAR